MSNVTAINFETLQSQETPVESAYPPLHLVGMPPLAERIDQLPSDTLTRARAHRFIAHVAMDDVYIDPCADEAPNTSLLESIRRANEGDNEARASARMNTHIAVIEALIKSGHITRVEMTRNDHGNWLQYGQAMLHVSANALRTQLARKYSGVMDRTEAETLNGQRIEDLGRANVLDDHYVFVPSLVPSEEEIPTDVAINEVGFFGDTMTAALQLTSTNGHEGEVESAFVAGVTETKGPRHDIEVMRKMYELAGYDASNWQPIDFLRNPLLIHKSNLPNGIADLVQLYDQLASQITSKQLFFGQETKARDYVGFSEVCRQRETGMESITEKVLTSLLDGGQDLTSPEEAVILLAKLVGPLGVEYAVNDLSIDPLVFGPDSAEFIYQARFYQQEGQLSLMNEALQLAISKAVTRMCGLTIKNILEELGLESKEDELDEDCEYMSKKCPVCGKKDVWTVSTKTQISGSCGCVVKK